MTTKVQRISSLKDQNQEIILIEYDGEIRYFTMDEVEETLNNYFSIVDRMNNEKELRNKHDNLKEAWDQYRVNLYLVCHDKNDILEE